MRIPVNCKGGIVFFDADWFGVSIAGQPCGELIGGVQQPRVAGVGGKQDKLADCNDAPIVIGCPALNVANLVDQTKGLAIHHALARSTLDRFATPTGFAMELFTKLFGNLLTFVYHCFDRIVIHGYLSALSRPEQVVHFFRQVLGVPVVCKEILSQRTADYQNWVDAFARNHHTPIGWAEKGVRKEDHVRPWLRRMAKDNAYGVYFIFKSMEQGPTFRISSIGGGPIGSSDRRRPLAFCVLSCGGGARAHCRCARRRDGRRSGPTRHSAPRCGRSQPGGQRGEQPAHPLLARRDGDGRESALVERSSSRPASFQSVRASTRRCRRS